VSRRAIVVSVAGVMLLAGIVRVATWPLSTRQGVNYKQTTRYIPAYVKSLDFIQRHVQYNLIAGSVCHTSMTEGNCLLALLDWTAANIRHTPDGWPVIDDHVLHIIIRGHGVSDQIADVFTTLATYAGLPAFFRELQDPQRGTSLVLAFVRVGDGWVPVDAERHVVFRDDAGRLATVAQLLRRPQLMAAVAPAEGVDYTAFVAPRFLDPFTVPDPLRAELHRPWPRMKYEVGQILHVRASR